MQVTEEMKKALHEAVMGAAEELGPDVVIKALCPSSLRTQADARPVATVVAVDEYGPRLEWERHWVECIGSKLYTHREASAPGLSQEQASEAYKLLAELITGKGLPSQLDGVSMEIHDWLCVPVSKLTDIIRSAHASAQMRILTRASAATVAEPSEQAWKNERCYYGVCDEEEQHDSRCTAWQETAQQQAEPGADEPEDDDGPGYEVSAENAKRILRNTGYGELAKFVGRAAQSGQRAGVALLADEHKGMRVDYQGLFEQARAGLRREPSLAEMLRQFQDHVTELGRRWYAGDTAVVDEFLQLYCVEREARAAIAVTSANLEGQSNG